MTNDQAIKFVASQGWAQKKGAAYFSRLEGAHSDAGTVPYAGEQTPLLKVDVNPALDTYQAVAQGETCYAVVTLTVAKGDPDRLPDFKLFMASLQLKK